MRKKCLIILIILMFNFLINVFFYRVNASEMNLKDLVYAEYNNDKNDADALFRTKDNTDKLFQYRVNTQDSEDLEILKKNNSFDVIYGTYNLVRYNWLHSVNSIVKYVNSDLIGYKGVMVSDSSTISDAIKGLEMARKEIASFIGGDEEVTDGRFTITFKIWVPGLGVVGEKDRKSEALPSEIRSSNAFRKIIDSNMPANMVANDYVNNPTIKAKVDEVFTNFDRKIYTAIQNLRAALDSKNKKGSKDGIYIGDNYKTKFLYTLPQIRTYSAYYSMKNMGDNISTTEQELLKRAWGAKAAAKAAGYPNIETSQDIYVRKKDDKSTKLNYNKDQIWMYLQIFSPNTSGFLGISEKSDADEIAVKWANKLSGTNNYNTTDPQKISSAYGYLRGIQNVVNAGLEAINNSTDAVIDITSTVKTDAEGEAAAAAADSKEHKIYDGRYELPEFDHSKNGDTDTTDLDTIIDSADSFINSGTDNKISDKNLQQLSESIYSILLIVGIIVAVIIGAILGIRFMTGSVEQQADVKKLLVPYIAGCVVVFGAFGIWKIAVTIIASI